MKSKRTFQFIALSATIIIVFSSCQKNNPDSSQLYIPSNNDVTATASLQELMDGHAHYVSNYGEYHGCCTPESYSPSQWRSIMLTMAPYTGMTPAEVQLITKYVS